MVLKAAPRTTRMRRSVAIQQVLPFGNAAADLPRPAGNAGAARTGLHLHYSNRTERLLEALIENLEVAKRRRAGSLFDAAMVVVPNRQIATYLKFGIARAAGIASNLEMPFLRVFLEDVIADCRPDIRIVSGNLLRGLVLDLLSDPPLLAGEDLAPLRSYLLAAGEDPDAVDFRRWQLSGQIAHLLEEYDYSRPEMLEAWAAGRRESPDKDHDADAERGQRRVGRGRWGGARGGAGARVDRRGRAANQPWLTAPAAFRSLRPEDIARVLPRQVHVFGISYAARAFHEIFAALARATDLHLYTIAPCLEFEEDAGTGPETPRRKLPSRAERMDPASPADSEDPYRLTQEAETPALPLWGRPPRANNPPHHS